MKKRSGIQGMALSILSGLLFSAAYADWGLGWISLIALVPLLMVENLVSDRDNGLRGSYMFLAAFTAFLVWNVISTFWVWFATAPGAVFALIANSLFMTVLFFLFHKVRLRMGRNEAYVALIAFWLAFEYMYLNIELSWPWLHLGNALSGNVQLIQWYEYTGFLGGSFWILLVNILMYELLRMILRQDIRKRIVSHALILSAIIILPLIFSLFRYHTYEEQGTEYDILILQPNIEPYHEKFNTSVESQLKHILFLTEQDMDSAVDYVVFPETALPLYVTEDSAIIEALPPIRMLRAYNSKYPGSTFIVGLTSRREYHSEAEASETAHKYEDFWFDEYNAALQVDTSGMHQFYRKSKLVPGVETLPYVRKWKWLNSFIINLGGPRNSLGVQEEPLNLINPQDSLKVAPVICYESVYGEYVSRFVRKGASFIFIMTNDGWWRDTPGYKQHARYARMRAIETRRSIARSANTGISSFINQRGDVIESLGWWKEGTLRQKIHANTKKTLFVQYGNYPGRIAAFIAVLILLHFLSFVLMRKQR